jgi:hypothetical protein
VEPFVLVSLVFVAVPFFAFFFADPGVELARRLIPDPGEDVLPLVAGDMGRLKLKYKSEGKEFPRCQTPKLCVARI